jgi:alkylation response protein AidB-like acyl-CoA dehydrogenase
MGKPARPRPTKWRWLWAEMMPFGLTMRTRSSGAYSIARLFLFDVVARLWTAVANGGEPSVEARAQVRLASCHVFASAVQVVDLVYLTGGATSLYTSFPLERGFRDVHAMTQHLAVYPRVIEMVGRVLFGLEPETPVF